MSILDEVLDQAPEYFHKYIRLVGSQDPIVMMEEQSDELDEFLGSIDPNLYPTAYEDGKWSIKEVVGHIVDVERVFGYRALCFCRGDKTALPGFDHDQYVKGADFNNTAMEELLEEFYHLRQANLLLFKNIEEAQWEMQGNANGKTITVKALSYIMPGHVQHHMNVIESKYL
ncbi:MAG: DinB family protein [Luteibaculum sp.]